MTVADKPVRRETAPALFRLLSESTLSRSALDCCGVPLALVDAVAPKPLVRFVNTAFERFFGYPAHETLGKALPALLFRNDQALARRLTDGASRWELTAWCKDGAERSVAVTASKIRSVEGVLTHWVLVFSDLGEIERLRAEVQALRRLAQSPVHLQSHRPTAPSFGERGEGAAAHEDGLARALLHSR